MKTTDFLFVIVLLAIFLPFICIDVVGAWFHASTLSTPYLMAFVKFFILASMGELLGHRLKSGEYLPKGFGLIPHAVVWGVLGVFIAYAMTIFAVGTPRLVETLGCEGVVSAMGEGLTAKHLLASFSISVAMNCIFAPLFMTFHKITDLHISHYNGSMKSLIRPIPMGKMLTEMNWNVQWNFVFKKTIPFFWIPAHTITFMLPPAYRVLMAAALGVALGVFLSVASIMGKKA